jgi:hypothetical protein
MDSVVLHNVRKSLSDRVGLLLQSIGFAGRFSSRFFDSGRSVVALT